MSISRAQECLAKEVESLERAKQTHDEDLKHLHETIAKQWRLLAKAIETGPVKTRAGDDRKANGGRRSKLMVTPRSSNVARLRPHANRQHSVPGVAGHLTVEPARRHRRRTRANATELLIPFLPKP